MRYARFIHHGRTSLGVVAGDKVHDLSALVPEAAGDGAASFGVDDLIRLGYSDANFGPAALGKAPSMALSEVKLLSPIVHPTNILCLALNYPTHVAETEQQRPAKPYTFLKSPGAIIGPDEPVVTPAGCGHLSFEAELAVVIGKPGKRIPADRAYEHIWGYTIFNDMSARDLGATNLPTISIDWFLSKSFDTSAPMGPWVVSRPEISDPQALPIRLAVNGETKQDGNTGHMFYKIAETIEFLSRNLTLQPGDIIATGTPGGAKGAVSPGDRIVIDIGGIGRLANPIVAAQ